MTSASSSPSEPDGGLTDAFLLRVGQRVRGLRTTQGLTVQQLADRAGVSRRLLTQIEHGQANPSLVTITRVARQLGTETTALLEDGSDAAVHVYADGEQVQVWSSPAGSSAHLLAATSPTRSADLWRWELAPGDSYEGQADPARSQELFHVLSGTLTLVADGQEHRISAGASARLDSDRAYTYRNDGRGRCVFVRTVALAGRGG